MDIVNVYSVARVRQYLERASNALEEFLRGTSECRGWDCLSERIDDPRYWLFWTWCSAATELGCKEVITHVCDRHPLLYNRFKVKAWESHIEQNTDESRSVLILLMGYRDRAVVYFGGLHRYSDDFFGFDGILIN